MTPTLAFPRFRAVADQALLVEFGETISDDTHHQVTSLDTRLAETPFPGFIEAVPAYVSLLICFDAILTDHTEVEKAIKTLLVAPALPSVNGTLRQVDICYDEAFSLDLSEVSRQVSLSSDAVIKAHLGATYQVIMYGFAPGYAYLGGTPTALHLPRKPTAKRGVPAGSVIIAAAQCLITTLTMPTGWWIIGRSPTRILTDDPATSFLFAIGDQVRFNRVDRATFDSKNALP